MAGASWGGLVLGEVLSLKHQKTLNDFILPVQTPTFRHGPSIYQNILEKKKKKNCEFCVFQVTASQAIKQTTLFSIFCRRILMPLAGTEICQTAEGF